MLILLFFSIIPSCVSDLQPGEDPYEILGLKKSANKTEIKTAYRKLTIKFHPDLNKDKDAETKWIKVNDAYEILSDPDRKSLFDRFGVVGAKSEGSPNAGVKYGFYGYSYFGEEQKKGSKEHHIASVNTLNFDDFVANESECIFLIYNSLICDNCEPLLDLFEEFSSRLKKIVKCALIDVEHGPGLAKSLGAKSMPSFVYYRREGNSTVTKILSDKVISMRQLDDFLTSVWPKNIQHLYNLYELKSFLNVDPNAVHVVMVTRTSSSAIIFNKVASTFRKDCLFAILEDPTIETSEALNITTYPQVLISRNQLLPARRVYLLNHLAKELVQYGKPTLFKVDRYSLGRFCPSYCFVRCGDPNSSISSKLTYINATTGVVKNASKFARSMGMKEGDWLVLFTEIGRFARIGKDAGEIERIESFAKDYSDGKIRVEAFPEGFEIEWTWEAFVAEGKRFVTFIGQLLWPARYSIAVSIASLVIYIVNQRKEKAQKNK